MLEKSTSIVDVDVPALLEDSTGPYKEHFLVLFASGLNSNL
jgi:hypothetical protein